MSLPLNFGSLVLIQEGAASHAGGIQISYDEDLGTDVSAAVQGDVYVITYGPGCTLGTLMQFIDDDPNLPETTVLLDLSLIHI